MDENIDELFSRIGEVEYQNRFLRWVFQKKLDVNEDELVRLEGEFSKIDRR